MAEDHNNQKQTPSLPADWTRCHTYIERKHRFCRQVKLLESNYCGYHATDDDTKRRIPCPFDPSHDILENLIEKHKKVCPKLTRQKDQETRPYYRQDINGGGHGGLGPPSTSSIVGSEWAQHIAMEVLRVHQRLYGSTSNGKTQSMTDVDIHNSIAMMDLSQPELDGGLPTAVEHFRIKSGGTRHLHQQASLIGHLRRIGVLLPVPNTSSTNTAHDVQFLEMGAGRGMFGLLAAGVAAACGAPKVHLIMVERAGARSKADTVLRKAKESTAYMKLQTVEWSRIQCDLAHVHVPTILASNGDGSTAAVGEKRKTSPNTSELVVVAKHLCGAGTDLALKSLQSLDVDACVMATCCHGVCAWDLFVGRDFLIQQFEDTPFGVAEFELLRKWSAGTVANCKSSEGEHVHEEIDERDPCSVAAVVRALDLKCGIQGLGRACQRLIDGGRCDYMRNILFPGTHDVELCHYVDTDVTPQNAILVAKRKSKAKAV